MDGKDVSMQILFTLEDLQSQKSSKIRQKLIDCLQREDFGIITRDKVFWVEHHSFQESIPNDVFKHLKSFMKKQGYKFLYDLTKGASVR